MSKHYFPFGLGFLLPHGISLYLLPLFQRVYYLFLTEGTSKPRLAVTKEQYPFMFAGGFTSHAFSTLLI
jgi:hypothetical protein